MAEKVLLPFQPGYTFCDPSKTHFGLNQTLEYSKGCPRAGNLPSDSPQCALDFLQAENSLNDDTLAKLTYGQKRFYLSKAPLPESVVFDSKEVLCFFGYYREEIENSTVESYRIHHVKVVYYLQDDTFEMYEPRVRNSGLPQGLVLRRNAVPKPGGGFYHWKDLNIDAHIEVFSKHVHIYDCDLWTKEYLRSGGIVLNAPPGDIPKDPYIENRKRAESKTEHSTPFMEEDKLWKFLNKDRMVLRFFAIWDDTVDEPKEKIKVIIQYYLSDDTMEVLQVHYANNGRDPCPVLVKRQKIPFSLDTVSKKFPSCYLEYSDKEIEDWYTPMQLGIGKTVNIYQRKIYIYDCDSYTRKYYAEHFDINLDPPISVDEPAKPDVLQVVPPHTGLGSWEDSLQSCLHVVPKPPRKDTVRELFGNFDSLRYTAHMETNWPIDATRSFVITFFPTDDTVTVFETSAENSGIAGGCFMKKTRLVKKGKRLVDEPPTYYTAADFYIGATVNCSGRKFVLDDADDSVLKFMRENKHLFSDEAIKMHEDKVANRKSDERGRFDVGGTNNVMQKLDKGFHRLQDSRDCKSLLKKYLTKQVYQRLRNKKTSMGATLLDVVQSGMENLDSGIGVYAPDAESYNVFADLFNPIIEEYHKGFGPMDKHPRKDFGDVDALVNVDPTGQYVISTRVRCGRSLRGYPFNPCLTKDQYKEMEQKVSNVLASMPGELRGQYYPLTGMDKAVQQRLVDDHFLFKEGDRFLQAANACRFWPAGRGIFHNNDKTFLVWVNEEDHLRIISMEKGGNLKRVFKRLVEGVNVIENKLPFSRDERLGYLTFCPTNLGTTIRASVHIKVPKLARNKTNLDMVAGKYNLQVRGTRGEHTESEGGIYDISNKRRMGLTEFQAVKEMQDGILELIQLEKACK